MSIYKLKCDILSRSLNLVNDYIHKFEFGENRIFTHEDEISCYNGMIVTVENGKILDIFAKILFKDGKERTRQELIALQHLYINLIRKEIGNKTLKFPDNEFMIIRRI